MNKLFVFIDNGVRITDMECIFQSNDKNIVTDIVKIMIRTEKTCSRYDARDCVLHYVEADSPSDLNSIIMKHHPENNFHEKERFHVPVNTKLQNELFERMDAWCPKEYTKLQKILKGHRLSNPLCVSTKD